MVMNDFYLHPKVESKLKQVIFGDLVSKKYGLLYKNHTLKLIELIKKFSTELNIESSDTKVLLASAYGLHWGCANLFTSSDSHFDNPFRHHSGCLRLASSKIERFLYYHASKYFSQKEILRVIKTIEDQSLQLFDERSLSSILFEATIISWAEMIIYQEFERISSHTKIELTKVGKSFLLEEQEKLKSSLLKQMIQKIW